MKKTLRFVLLLFGLAHLFRIGWNLWSVWDRWRSNYLYLKNQVRVLENQIDQDNRDLVIRNGRNDQGSIKLVRLLGNPGWYRYNQENDSWIKATAEELSSTI